MLRRLAPAAVATIALLAGCAPADKPATQEPTVTAETTVADITPEPTPTETSSEAAPSTPAPESSEPTEEPSPTVDPSTPAVDSENPDLVDGIRTNDFNRITKVLGDMQQRQSETNPQDHTAVFNYERPDNQVSAQVMAYLPMEGGDPAPVFERGDAGYMTAVESAVLALRETAEAVQNHVEAGGLAWDCVEAQGAQQDGKIDHALCVSHLYGRVIEVQVLNVHMPDNAAWRTALSNILEVVGESLVDLKG